MGVPCGRVLEGTLQAPSLPDSRRLFSTLDRCSQVPECVMETHETDSEPRPWWGTYSIEEGRGGRWDVGPSTLWLYRTDREWRVIHRPSAEPGSPDPLANRSGASIPVPEEELASVLNAGDDRLQTTRHSFRETEPSIDVKPALADRPVVSRPEHPLHVPSGETVTLYLSTALWIRVTLPESSRCLQELPSYRMSDTWFGPSTVQGELCYATRTAGRLRRESLPIRLHRALTPLRIKNTAEDALPLERVQLPAPHLSLYATPEGLLWTQTVTMTRTEGAEGAGVQIRDGSPVEVDRAELIQEPRQKSEKRLFTSTFSTLGALFSS